jgi:phosphohistidine phosphatase
MASASLGSYRRRKWGGTCDVDVYPLRVQREMDDWPESGIRRRRWQPLATALRRVDDAGLRAIIARLPDAALRSTDDAEPAGRTENDRSAPRLLYLLRHAKSSWEFPDLDDIDRPLAPRGERAADRMKRYIVVADIRPDLVLCSPALRAQQTLERVMPALSDQAVVETARDLYGRGPRAMIDLLQNTRPGVASVMLIGHNPDIQSLATLLAGSGDEAERARLEKKLPTGALTTFVFRGNTWTGVGPGTCELHSLVRPRDIRIDHS